MQVDLTSLILKLHVHICKLFYVVHNSRFVKLSRDHLGKSPVVVSGLCGSSIIDVGAFKQGLKHDWAVGDCFGMCVPSDVVFVVRFAFHVLL